MTSIIELNKELLLKSLDLYPLPLKKLSYGTAGFRDKHDLPLDNIFVKMGILACLRSYLISISLLEKNNNNISIKCTGVMVTASHNPSCDNGVKIVDYNGGMLTQSWEIYAEEFANSNGLDAINVLNKIINNCNINKNLNINGIVIIGRDTRSHSERLANCIKIGIESLGGKVIDLGEVTTPQLHFVVQQTNKLPIINIEEFNISNALNEYYSTLSKGFMKLRESVDNESIIIDTSNGIGDKAIRNLVNYLNNNYTNNSVNKEILSIDIRNGIGSGEVNDGCGAEYVQKGQKPPNGVNSIQDKNKVICSYDGDADRIVFHSYLDNYNNNDNEWTLFDGDKISVLFAI
jgi:phosphoacetylglucosamine mutase